MDSSTAYLQNFRKQFKVLGSLQLTLALFSMILATVNLILVYTVYSNTTSNLQISSPGLWCGIWFLVAGALGVAAANTLSICNFVSSMVMSIIAIIASSTMLGIEITVTVEIGTSSCFQNALCIDQDYSSVFGVFVTHVILSVFAFIEFVVATVMSGYGCNATCCPERTPVVHVLDNTDPWNPMKLRASLPNEIAATNQQKALKNYDQEAFHKPFTVRY